MDNHFVTPPARRVLFVHSSDELYGSDRVLLQLVSGLDRRRYQPIVVLPCDLRYEGRLTAALEERGIVHHSVNMGVLRRRYLTPTGTIAYLARLACGVSRIRRLLRRYEASLVHSSTSAVWAGALAARLCGLPHVWHVHEVLRSRRWATRLMCSLIIRYSARVVAVSRAVGACFSDSVTPPVRIIWNGIGCTAFGQQVNGRAFRRSCGFDDGEIVVGMVGRISHRKGHGLLLQAAGHSAKACPRLRILILGGTVPGEEGYRSELEAQVREVGLEGKVVFAPYSPDAAQAMRAIDMLVLPSLSPEAFGLVILEAMASERPVIAAAHGGPLEIVRHGETGLLFPPGDADALSAAMLLLAQDPELAARMGQAGRRRAVEHFSLSRFSQSFSELYDELLAGQPFPGRTAQWVGQP